MISLRRPFQPNALSTAPCVLAGNIPSYIYPYLSVLIFFLSLFYSTICLFTFPNIYIYIYIGIIFIILALSHILSTLLCFSLGNSVGVFFFFWLDIRATWLFSSSTCVFRLLFFFTILFFFSHILVSRICKLYNLDFFHNNRIIIRYKDLYIYIYIYMYVCMYVCINTKATLFHMRDFVNFQHQSDQIRRHIGKKSVSIS